MQSCLAGIVYVKVDGRQLSVRGTATVSPQPTTRTGVVGADGIHGFTCEWRVPYVEIEISVMPEFPLSDLYQINDATITVELGNGQVYVLRNAWHADEIEHDTVEGTATVRFEGRSCVLQ